MLVLAASDELSAIVSGAAGNESGHFLQAASLTVGNLNVLASPFLAFLIGVFTVAGAIVLWIELLMRETAVYVIVLMLPLAFAAFVWPARRIWAVRTIELLGALILSKFAIVAVLSLGGAALGSALGHASVTNWLAGLVLVLMAAFMPWALLRLVPLAEIASSAAGGLRHELMSLRGPATVSDIAARKGEEWISSVTSHMRRQAQDARTGDVRADRPVASERQPENTHGGAAPQDVEPAEPGNDEAADSPGAEPSGADVQGVSAAAPTDGRAPARTAPWGSEPLDGEPHTRDIECLGPGTARRTRPLSNTGHDPGPLPPAEQPPGETQ
jgi:hypothetical protein